MHVHRKRTYTQTSHKHKYTLNLIHFHYRLDAKRIFNLISYFIVEFRKIMHLMVHSQFTGGMDKIRFEGNIGHTHVNGCTESPLECNTQWS